MKSTKKLAMAAVLALGLLALFAGPASAMKYSLNIAHPEGLSTGVLSAGGMATDSAGNLYIAEQSRVVKYNAGGQYLGKIAGIGGKDVDVDAAGNIWLASTGYLYKFSPAGTQLKKVTTEGPNGVAVDPAGNVYSIGPYSVYTYDTNGNSTGVWFNVSFDGHGADIDSDSTGKLWTSGAASKVIRRHEPGGLILNQWNVPTYQGGVAGDGAGNVWVAEPGFCRVRKYSSTGASLDSFGECSNVPTPGKLSYSYMPHERPGITWGPGGVVWVSNGTEVQKWIP
jgi:sugar lactone lactonase YvrE